VIALRGIDVLSELIVKIDTVAEPADAAMFGTEGWRGAHYRTSLAKLALPMQQAAISSPGGRAGSLRYVTIRREMASDGLRWRARGQWMSAGGPCEKHRDG
jgi:hypothetical protein